MQIQIVKNKQKLKLKSSTFAVKPNEVMLSVISSDKVE